MVGRVEDADDDDDDGSNGTRNERLEKREHKNKTKTKLKTCFHNCIRLYHYFFFSFPSSRFPPTPTLPS